MRRSDLSHLRHRFGSRPVRRPATIERLLRATLSCLAPVSCLECGGEVDECEPAAGEVLEPWSAPLPAVCAACRKGLPWRPVETFRYGRELRRVTGQGRTALWLPFVAAAWYEDPVRSWILSLKFGGRRVLARVLAGMLANTLELCELAGRLDAFVPVPSHPWKRWCRGIEPTALVAGELSARFGIPVLPVLRKVRRTPALSGLRLVERRGVVAGAFRARRVEGAQLLRVGLVDDVLTTGSTAQEAMETLRAGGVGRVVVLAVASSAPAARRFAAGLSSPGPGEHGPAPGTKRAASREAARAERTAEG